MKWRVNPAGGTIIGSETAEEKKKELMPAKGHNHAPKK
jgi:hypothetical protein